MKYKDIKEYYKYYNEDAPTPYPLEALDNYIQRKRIDWILSCCKDNELILDIGCLSPFMEIQKNAIGVEISLPRIKKIKSYFSNIEIINGLGEHLPFRDKTFEKIILAEILEHVLDPDVLMEEVVRVLKGNGQIIVTVPKHEENNIEHLRSYSNYMLRILFYKFNLAFEISEDNNFLYVICIKEV